MSASTRTRWAGVAALGLSLLAPLAAPFVPAAQARPTGLADPSFGIVWDRTDLPVDQQKVSRSWMWGPEGFHTSYEPYAQGPGGQHLVQYFDKSRMEINNPSADRNSQWFVTNGLLVVDMIAGRIQSGDQQFTPSTPANLPVAGDANGSPETPTYASLARVASLKGDNRAANRTGQQIREGLGRTGPVATLDNLAPYAKYGIYEPTTGHNIADVFWSFMNAQGPVYQGGQYVNGKIVDWLFAMGYPVTEPYWIKIRVNNQDRWVLMQAFQRRVLTYSPWNPDGWKVEMANVGRAYYDWRYRQPAPTPTPIATASIALTPAGGDIATPITVTGRIFPAFAAVTLSVEKASANYTHTLQTLAVKADGTFSIRITLPTDAARFGDLTIAATANGGAIRATQVFRAAAVLPAVPEVVQNKTLSVHGVGFPANEDIRVGLQVGNNVSWVATGKSNAEGAFDASVPVGNRAVGSTFKVTAMSASGFIFTSKEVRVIAQPVLQVIPSRGPAGVSVTLRGTNWPANRQIRIGRKPVETKTELWLPDKPVTDATGTFSVSVFIGPEYAIKSDARIFAQDDISKVRVDTSYAIAR